MIDFSSMSPDVEAARRIAFTIAKAEAALGLGQTGLPVGARLDHILQEAAARPDIIDADTYAIIFRLAQGEIQ